ncbi:polysaccharide biosynthesis/export family protein [Phycisphaerales bacterium AB-hyl4]|uniref:Polysaccharide biosynthesis/export family protein n=1 Tax=Natronomicrosphaera hydrolytica TaxID=3242702 RepID=A0ABV4U1N9_9BACT
MRRVWRWSLFGLLAVVLVGCEVDSFFDQSVVGRWERTPVTLPILDRLDVIDEQAGQRLDVTGVQAEDLVPDVREYVVGSGDLITVTIFELIRPGEDAVQTRRIDEVGRFRLPIVGAVRASNMTPTELEQHISEVLESEGVLRNAEVSVIVQEARQSTFSVLGEPAQGGTAVGTYTIPKPDFRLLDALAMARGVPGRTKRLLIYRQSPLTDEVAGVVRDRDDENGENGDPGEAQQDDPADLIDELLRGEDRDTNRSVNGQPERREAPRGIDDGLGTDEGRAPWVYVGSEWVRADSPAARAGRRTSDRDDLAALSEMITQRIIEIPYDRLLEGDMRYNIVIRPGDVIRVPAPTAGFVYIMGEINRPGAYVVPGENDLTLKQLIASGGNLGPLAVPERVDLTRRVGTSQEATVRLNLRAIFNGTEPDLFLKPNDIVNIGTSFWAQPLAIFRNGFRVTYGFGFLLDRNFGPDVFD